MYLDIPISRSAFDGLIREKVDESIKAVVPLAEMLKYAPSLNSITGGRGSYVMEFSTYEEVPRELAVRIVEEHKAAKQAVAP